MSLDPVRRAVLTDIAFEIGGQGLAGFVQFLAAIRNGAWFAASVQLKNSKLFAQVPSRENRNIDMVLNGQFPPGVICGEDLTKLNEGLTLIAKPDRDGKWEYGFGHDIPAPGPGQTAPTLTEQEAEALFEVDYALATERARADLGTDAWGES